MTLITVGVLTVLFLIPIFAMDGMKRLYTVPSYDVTSFVHTVIATPSYTSLETIDTITNFNEGSQIALYYFMTACVVESLVFVIAMDKIRTIKAEFSILTEFICFAVTWIFTTNLIVWLMI